MFFSESTRLLTLSLERWSPGKNPTNTVHVADIAGALWECAGWMAKLGRKAADEQAGEEIKFHNDKSKVKEVEGMPAHDEKIVAPLFNLVRILTHLSHLKRILTMPAVLKGR